jgi:hypothetical protein
MTIVGLLIPLHRGSRSASLIGARGRSVSQGSRVVSSVEGREQSLPGRLPGDRAVSSDRGRAQLIRHYTPEPRTSPAIGLQDPAIVGGWTSQGMPIGNRTSTPVNPHPLAAKEQRLPQVSGRPRQYPTPMGRAPLVQFEDPWGGRALVRIIAQ